MKVEELIVFLKRCDAEAEVLLCVDEELTVVERAVYIAEDTDSTAHAKRKVYLYD